MSPPDHRRALALSLGRALVDAAALEDLAALVGLESLEASVRGDGRAVAGGRMMIERASLAAAAAVARALGIAWPAPALRLIEASRRAGLPLIVGWDVGAPRALGKAYLNASDASAGLRTRLARALDLPCPAHVVGVNVGADGATERKVYVQSTDVRGTLAPYGALPARVAEEGERLGVAAGAVVSYDVEGDRLRPRAAFVALRDGTPSQADPLFALLPGGRSEAVRAALPFAAGAPRSLGLSLHSDHWTAYYKPATDRRTLYDLEPRFRFRVGDGEVGVFVEPLAPGVRAYARTARSALSYRVLEGAPGRADLRALMAWLTAVVSREEGAEGPAPPPAPPPPWRARES